MSADDTILVIPRLRHGRWRYYTLRVQAAENIRDQSDAIERTHNQRFTYSRNTALRIASRMQRSRPAEYGVRELEPCSR
mgnify:CR=1 FL=1